MALLSRGCRVIFAAGSIGAGPNSAVTACDPPPSWWQARQLRCHILPCAIAAPPRRAVGATAQRVGEPAWHRRRRRQRGTARTILRIAAAGRLIACHHSSSTLRAMPGGRGAGHDAVVAKITAMEQQLRDLRRQAGIGNGGGAPRGGAGRSEGGDAARGHGTGGGGEEQATPRRLGLRILRRQTMLGTDCIVL